MISSFSVVNGDNTREVMLLGSGIVFDVVVVVDVVSKNQLTGH